MSRRTASSMMQCDTIVDSRGTLSSKKGHWMASNHINDKDTMPRGKGRQSFSIKQMAAECDCQSRSVALDLDHIPLQTLRSAKSISPI